MRGRQATRGDERSVNDTIVLTIPTGLAPRCREPRARRVGSRLDLPFERMDDLQLAVLSMLDASRGENASLEISAEDGHVAVSVGPLRDGVDDDAGLELVLKRLTNRIEAARRDDGPWLTVFVARADGAPASASSG